MTPVHRISAGELAELEGLVTGRAHAVPWRAAVCSAPLWGTLITDGANTWGLTTFASFGPKYMKGGCNNNTHSKMHTNVQIFFDTTDVFSVCIIPVQICSKLLSLTRRYWDLT